MVVKQDAIPTDEAPDPDTFKRFPYWTVCMELDYPTPPTSDSLIRGYDWFKNIDRAVDYVNDIDRYQQTVETDRQIATVIVANVKGRPEVTKTVFMRNFTQYNKTGLEHVLAKYPAKYLFGWEQESDPQPEAAEPVVVRRRGGRKAGAAVAGGLKVKATPKPAASTPTEAPEQPAAGIKVRKRVLGKPKAQEAKQDPEVKPGIKVKSVGFKCATCHKPFTTKKDRDMHAYATHGTPIG